jgi:hypothetical protein
VCRAHAGLGPTQPDVDRGNLDPGVLDHCLLADDIVELEHVVVDEHAHHDVGVDVHDRRRIDHHLVRRQPRHHRTDDDQYDRRPASSVGAPDDGG